MAGLTLDEGKKLIAIARASILRYMKERKPADVSGSPARLMEKSGAFVTLETYPEKELRGCIGFIMAVKPLAQTVADCAVSAAVGDPRFMAVNEKELDSLVVEVSVLTPLMKIGVEKPEHYAKAVQVGKHGLYIEDGYYSGLLLPQVPVEQGWDAREFLSQTCVKAGMPPNAWQGKRTGVYTFEAQIFSEKTPRGEVFEKKLKCKV